MGLRWRASLPPPPTTQNIKFTPKQELRVPCSRSQKQARLSREACFPAIAHPLPLFRGKEREDICACLQCECLGHCSEHALICKTSWNHAQFAEGQTKALRGQEFAQGHTHVSSRARVYTRGAHLCTPAAWARHTLSALSTKRPPRS